MKNSKFRIIISCLLISALVSGCSKDEKSDSGFNSETKETESGMASFENEQNDNSAALDITYGNIREEFNDGFEVKETPLTPNEVPEGYSLTLEAEEAVLTGNCAVSERPEYSEGRYVSGLNKEGDRILFKLSAEHTGFYNAEFMCHASDSGRVNYVELDGERIGEIICDSNGEIVPSALKNVYMEAGEHEISIVPYWGYVDYDCLKLTRSGDITEDTYNVTAELSNPAADDRTKRLYRFLQDIYGNYSLTGQYAEKGRLSTEYNTIQKETGKSFAVLGLDLMNYDGTSIANGASASTVETAYDWYANAGGIVQLLWHWHTPEPYLINDGSHEWYSSFYKENTTIDLDKIMSGEDENGYNLLMEDIDRISEKLEILRDSGVPVIWRPLHEASGGWFWWGNCSAESYKKLWNLMYDKMTNEHNLTNLIWMWNGENKEWYPGDDTVDIISKDIYQNGQNYSPYAGTFAEFSQISNEKKLVALSENGVIMDPERTVKENARWLFWGTWSDPYTLIKGLVINEEYTEKDMLIKAYNSDYTLTLDELPDIKNYPLS